MEDLGRVGCGSYARTRSLHIGVPHEVVASVEGDVDLRGFLGLDEKVRNGFQEIRMKFRIKADIPDEQLQELAALGQQYSPMFDSITKGVAVKVAAERMA